MYFVFYEMESVRGFTFVLNVICISTRHTKIFLRRRKHLPLDALQFIINCQKRKGRPIWRIRVDEDGSLANSYEFNKLLLTNDVTLETTWKLLLAMHQNLTRLLSGQIETIM